MNKDEFEGKWKQIRGQARQWWGKLTADDLERAGGKFEQFIGIVQEKYGYTREAAETEFNKRMAAFEARQKHAQKREQRNANRSPAQDILEGKWKQMHGEVRAWWGKLTDDDLAQAAGKAEAVIGLLQEKYGYTRERAEGEFKQRVKAYEASVKEKESVVPVPVV